MVDPEFHKREMQLIGSRNTTFDDLRMVIGHILSRDIPTAALQIHAFALEDRATMVPRYLQHRGSVLKAIGRF